MSEAGDQHELSLTPIDTRPVGTTILRVDRQFNIALVVATVVHVLFLTSFISAGVRQLGDPSGASDGISVDIVTEADLRALGAVPETAAGPPTPPTPPQSPPQQTAALPPQSPAQEPPPPEPRAEPPAAPSPPPPQAQPKAAPPERAAVKLDSEFERLLKIPENPTQPESRAPTRPEESAKAAKPDEARRSRPKERLRTSSLDLTLPPSFAAAPFGGGGVGVARSAGTTRSGENDTFARGVIAALQRTMPQLRDTRGRVTVRIKLDKDGSLVSTEVVGPSTIAGLDQSVVFATRQSSFPFPPRNATTADLTFLVTYIYR